MDRDTGREGGGGSFFSSQEEVVEAKEALFDLLEHMRRHLNKTVVGMRRLANRYDDDPTLIQFFMNMVLKLHENCEHVLARADSTVERLLKEDDPIPSLREAIEAVDLVGTFIHEVAEAIASAEQDPFHRPADPSNN
ncbi:MAG: hypothetical protein UT08_C0029G0003 [Candidatus Woesebacteria bacterium GW2011_GWB1_38_8]|uniref:Uncharacterized protein n=1 Tax=Candidatus Woesebacteria bacterium GW2011_GWB1_38_8 TaxID=1618570 RepID=A0A0G0L7M6_9BACT|nr:MAG: hypothetical protein UT08_C0029G0003 [Candidatus Woesebacteria bacterium GW2011_GWB1_38_8]